MKKLEFENRVVKIYSDQEADYILIEWLSPTIHAEYAEVCERFGEIIAAKKLKNGIYDIRLLGALSEESITYTNEVLIPALEPLELKKMATIVPANVFDKMVSDDMMENFREKLDQNQARTFTSLEEAETWIKQSPITNH